MRPTRRGPLPIVIIMNVILAILIAMIIWFIVAFIREFNSTEGSPSRNIYDSSEPSSSVSQAENSSEESSIFKPSSDEDTSSQSAPPPPYSSAVVPMSNAVDDDYFSDAVFIGDSLTDGIKLYDVMENATILSDTGLGLDNIYTKEVIEQNDGSALSVMDALKKEDPAKIYIMMGANSIGYEKDTFVKKYGAIVDSIKEIHPQAILYIESILPVTVDNNYHLDNAKIDEYNTALIELAEDKQVYYLDINSSLKDETGALPDEASPADGMHFGKKYYTKWFEYLKTHTVQ